MAKKISRLIGIVIIVLILRKLNFVGIKDSILNANKYYLVIGLFLTVVGSAFKAWRWNYLKKTQNINYRLSDSLIMYFSGMLAGIITPGRLGELSRLIYLKNDGHSYGKSLFGVVLDRLFDMFFLLLFGAISMFFFFTLFKKEIPYIVAIIIISTIIAVLLAKTDLIKKIISKIFNFIIPVKYQKSWQVNLQDFIAGFKNLKTKNYFIISGITILSWIIYYFQMWLFAQSLGIHIPFLYLSISVTIAGIITLIPISYSGIGTRDIALITLFSVVGISKELAITFSSLILSGYVLMATIGFACWLKKPLRFK